MHGHDIITDDFGVEIATYALMDSSNVKNILSYIQNPNNNLTEAQVMRCVTNLWNVLHQDALKTRPLRKTNFENYSDISNSIVLSWFMDSTEYSLTKNYKIGDIEILNEKISQLENKIEELQLKLESISSS